MGQDWTGLFLFNFLFLWLLSFAFLFDRPCMVDTMGYGRYYGGESECKGSAFLRIMRSAVLERCPDGGIS